MDLHITPGPPGFDRDKTFDDMRKLNVFMGDLCKVQLGKVIEIIM